MTHTVKQPERIPGLRARTAPLGGDQEPAGGPGDATADAIPMEQIERAGVAAPDYASGVGAAQLVVKPVMAD